jgi:hypothetical protein
MPLDTRVDESATRPVQHAALRLGRRELENGPKFAARDHFYRSGWTFPALRMEVVG